MPLIFSVSVALLIRTTQKNVLINMEAVSIKTPQVSQRQKVVKQSTTA